MEQEIIQKTIEETVQTATSGLDNLATPEIAAVKLLTVSLIEEIFHQINTELN